MMRPDTRILVGITGGIAAYKSCELVRLLKKMGCDVKVVMTTHAKSFVHPNTFAALSGHPVYDDLFDYQSNAMMHIELAKWADHIIIAPATANVIAKIAHGVADDLLTTICLATEAKLTIAPAMNKFMWENAATQANIDTLLNRHIEILPTEQGEQACGDNGYGRMLEPEKIIEILYQSRKQKLKNKKVLITAGPTQEAIDPVRYISNHSSGKMGYAFAEACLAEGADVILVTGPTMLTPPKGCQVIPIKTADEMLDAVLTHIHHQDIFIAAAAVADYKIKEQNPHKIKKEQATSRDEATISCDEVATCRSGATTSRGEVTTSRGLSAGSLHDLTLTFTQTPDILATVGKLSQKPYIIGFCAETENLIDNAKAKRKRKNCDLMIANQIHADGFPFYADENEIVVIDRDDNMTTFGKLNKNKLAVEVLSIFFLGAEKIRHCELRNPHEFI